MQPIVQLDPQLANQIAAGEVVERPASVVKELIENSLDAGANQIDVEVLQGGKQLIRIRDNGQGIPREQLSLALAPHATSKIRSLSDLEALHSFGFRGEALASISSVSKFSLTSKPPEQEQAWCARAEGRNMEVKIVPVPATRGTRIDVAELFYNTPARRRFLRTEKTEFYQIETVLKQVALANPEVTLSLKHNQRLSKRYKAAQDLQQQEQRLASVCSKEFVKQSVRINVEHQGLKLTGWLGLPSFHRSQNDLQFFFVNQRPVRDKVISHALRQAYVPLLPEGRLPAYVLFLEIAPEQVDVNVHPTKHEVRFHDVRTVHDFIVQATVQCIHQGEALSHTDSLGAEDAKAEDDVSSGTGLYGRCDVGQSKPSGGAFKSYQEFIAGAYAANLHDVSTQEEHLSERPQLRVIDSNHWLYFEANAVHLIDRRRLLVWLEQQVQSDNRSLLFPVLFSSSGSQDLAFKAFCKSKGFGLHIDSQMIKLVAAPVAVSIDAIEDLIHDWMSLSDEQEINSSTMQRWLFQLASADASIWSDIAETVSYQDLVCLMKNKSAAE